MLNFLCPSKLNSLCTLSSSLLLSSALSKLSILTISHLIHWVLESKHKSGVKCCRRGCQTHELNLESHFTLCWPAFIHTSRSFIISVGMQRYTYIYTSVYLLSRCVTMLARFTHETTSDVSSWEVKWSKLHEQMQNPRRKMEEENPQP